MSDVEAAPRAILFDLFNTLIFLDPAKLARRELGGVERIVTIPDIESMLAGLVSGPDVGAFYESVLDVSREIVEEQSTTHQEVSSALRFERALAHSGARGDVAALAVKMSESHMASLHAAAECPADRTDLLRALRRHYRIALVSNFDHAATAYRILDDARLTSLFDSIVISDDAGVRKPAEAIFHRACDEISIEPAACLHIGDSMRADVKGAVGAGLSALWVSGGGEPSTPALGAIADVAELPAWLVRRYGAPASD